MLDPSFYSGAYGKPRIPGAMYDDAPDQGYGGYSGQGTYVLSPENSVPTNARQPNRFQGFLSSLQQSQGGGKQGGLLGAVSAAQGGGIAGLAKFFL